MLLFVVRYVTDWYKTQEMYDKIILENSDDDIVFVNKNSDNIIFFSDGMNPNINLDDNNFVNDNPETVCHSC